MNIKTKFLALAVAFVFTVINMGTALADRNTVEIVNAADKTAKIVNAKSGTKIIVVDFSIDEDMDLVTDGVQNYADLDESAKTALLATHTKHAKQITQNGDYTFKLPSFGIYTVFVNESGTVENYPLTMHNPAFVTNHRTALNSDAIYDNFSLAKGYMKGELSNYYSLDEDGMRKVSETLFKRRAGDADIETIVKRTELMSKLYKYSKLPDNERTAAFETDIDIDCNSLTDFADYQQQGDDVKLDVVDRFLNFEELDGEDKFDNAFSQALFLEKVERSTLAAEIDVLVTDAKSKFNISTPKYDRLGAYTSSVSVQMVGKSFKTVAKFTEELEKLAGDTEIPTPGSTSKPGSSSGAGSGGGGRIDVKVPLIEKNDTDNSADKPLYSDIENGRWSYEPIYILSKRGVISGDGNGIFRPTDGITREEFVKIVISAFDMVSDGETSAFSDVEPNHWSYKYITSAKKYGIVNGRSETEFCPSDMLTREEAAVILNNIIKFKNIPVKMNGQNPEFIDKNDISEWSVTAVEYLYKCSIIDGYEDNSFAPKANITREQTAKLVYSLLKYLI